MSIRSFNEAARALVLWTSLQGDLLRHSPDPADRQAADDRLGLMTPILKGVLTDTAFRNCVEAQQVLGGHGYVTESGMEQFVRDARITSIYEGANGIQALDLVARKLPRNGGRAFMALTGEIAAFLKAHAADERLAPYLTPLKEGLDRLQKATMWFMQHWTAKPDHAAAGATDYMHLFGLVALGYMWAQMAKAAMLKAEHEPETAARMETKLTSGRFFMERIMPETAAHLARITAGADTLMTLPPEAF